MQPGSLSSAHGAHREQEQELEGAAQPSQEAMRPQFDWLAPPEDDYTVLGTVGQRAEPVLQALTQQTQGASEQLQQYIRERRATTVKQLNARKRYNLGETYTPQDLNPYARDKAQQDARSGMIKKMNRAGTDLADQAEMPFQDAQVRREVNYKNVGMLLDFTGDQGMILARRNKQIRAVTQRKVARAIKNARQMALLPYVGPHPGVEDEETEAMRLAFDKLQARAREQGM